MQGVTRLMFDVRILDRLVKKLNADPDLEERYIDAVTKGMEDGSGMTVRQIGGIMRKMQQAVDHELFLLGREEGSDIFSKATRITLE